MTLLEKIKNELTNRIEKANFQTIQITMKVSGDIITITPFAHDEIQAIEDVVYFIVSSSTVNNMDCETIDALAYAIRNYYKIRNTDIQRKTELQAYYEQYIKGHTELQFRDGSNYVMTIWNQYMQQNTDEPYYVFENKYPIETLDSTKDKEYIAECISLSKCFDYYSDWYKELYGVRPRYMAHVLDGCS